MWDGIGGGVGRGMADFTHSDLYVHVCILGGGGGGGGECVHA